MRFMVPMVVAAFAVTCGAARANVETAWTPGIPSGWEKATPSHLEGTGDFGFRAAMASPYQETSGDFDGDGRRDQAQLFINRKTATYGLFITLNARSVPRVYKLLEGPMNEIARVGLARVPPGEYANACAKSYGKAKDCTPEIVKIKSDGVDYFNFEFAARYYYWNGEGFASADIGD